MVCFQQQKPIGKCLSTTFYLFLNHTIFAYRYKQIINLYFLYQISPFQNHNLRYFDRTFIPIFNIYRCQILLSPAKRVIYNSHKLALHLANKSPQVSMNLKCYCLLLTVEAHERKIISALRRTSRLDFGSYTTDSIRYSLRAFVFIRCNLIMIMYLQLPTQLRRLLVDT